MLDVAILFGLVLLFGGSFVYARGCEHLKGARP